MEFESLLSTPDIKGHLSIDRCTFLLFMPSLSLWNSGGMISESEKRVELMSSCVTHYLGDHLDSDFPQGFPSELFARHYRTVDGVDIQFGSKRPKRKKISETDLLSAFGSSGESVESEASYMLLPNNYAFRVEFNPNKCSLDGVKDLLKNFSLSQSTDRIRISRLDIAIDYDCSICPEMVLCDGMKKSFTASGSDGLESVYFGTRHSRNFFRLYDKRKEQIEVNHTDCGHDWWRLELESKEAFSLDSPPPDYGKVFQRFSFYQGAFSSGDWILDMVRSQAMIFGLQNVLRRMPKTTQKRYRKIFKSGLLDRRIESPAFVFSREFPAALRRLKCQIMNACGYEVIYDVS